MIEYKTPIGIPILFNKSTSVNWGKDPEYNRSFIKTVGDYISEICKVAGYISLETVFKSLGISVDPNLLDIINAYRYRHRKLYFKVKCLNEQNQEYYLTLEEY